MAALKASEPLLKTTSRTIPEHKKLPRLPRSAKVSKRPILHPPIPSPYSGSQNQKCVYVSSHTPFIGAVKRVEKLLKLAEKRAMQSASTLAKRQPVPQARRGHGSEQDNVVAAATLMEERKAKRQKVGDLEAAGDVVVVKGTGKMVDKVLQLGLWFQQRDEYTVRLKTGSVGAIDDIEVHDVAEGQEREDQEKEPGQQLLTSSNGEISSLSKTGTKRVHEDNDHSTTRIRYLSSLEVIVSLR